MKNKMRTMAGAFAPAISVMLFAATPAHAASVQYLLDVSDALPDGISYQRVTISDGAGGAVDFKVEALDSLLNLASSNFGIQSFAFNVEAGGAVGANVGNLPAGWIVRDQYQMNTFGVFDIKLYGGGNSHLNTLTFSILGIANDSPSSYAGASSGTASDGNVFFAARVADLAGCATATSSRVQPNHVKCPTSAFVGGVTTDAVPLPAAAWLFGTGMVGIIARARRRKV